MTEPNTLQFFDFSDDSRLRFNQLLNDKPLSDRARRFVRLAYDGACEHGAAGLRVRYYRGMLWVHASQERLGELLSCSDRTFREMLRRELEPLGFVKTVKATPDQLDGPPREVTVYCISLERLEALPSLDPTDEVDAAILASDGDPFDTRPAFTESPASGGISAGSSGGSSGGISAGSSGGSSALMNHEIMNHERMNELNSINQVMNHESPAAQQHGSRLPAAGGESGPSSRFDQIQDRHVRAIAGFAVEHDGKLLTLAPFRRLEKAIEYFQDAVSAGKAADNELPAFVAVFRHVARRADVVYKSKYLRTMWTNRHSAEKPLSSVLTPDDRRYSRELLTLRPAESAAVALSQNISAEISGR